MTDREVYKKLTPEYWAKAEELRKAQDDVAKRELLGGTIVDVAVEFSKRQTKTAQFTFLTVLHENKKYRIKVDKWEEIK